MRWNNVWNTMSYSGPPSCFGKVWAFLITTHPALHCTQLTSLFLTQKPVPSASLSNNKGLDNVSVFDTLRMRSVCHTPPFTTASEPNNIQHKVCQVLCVSWDVVLFCRNMSGNEKALENLIFRNWNHFAIFPAVWKCLVWPLWATVETWPLSEMGYTGYILSLS